MLILRNSVSRISTIQNCNNSISLKSQKMSTALETCNADVGNRFYGSINIYCNNGFAYIRGTIGSSVFYILIPRL
jgi:hypothetical protein